MECRWSTASHRWHFNRAMMFQRSEPGFLLCVVLLAFLACGTASYAQTVYPIAECVEYPTSNSATYIAHFGYYVPDAAGFYLGAAFPNNYFEPAVSSAQPSTFYPGYGKIPPFSV